MRLHQIGHGHYHDIGKNDRVVQGVTATDPHQALGMWTHHLLELTVRYVMVCTPFVSHSTSQGVLVIRAPVIGVVRVGMEKKVNIVAIDAAKVHHAPW